MKHVAFVPLCVVFFQLLAAQDASTREIRPGIVHATYQRPGPSVVHVLSVPLKDPRYRIVSYRPKRLTTVTEQVAQATQAGQKVIAAINADFFSFQTSLPVGLQVVDGHLVHAGPGSIRSQFAVTTSGGPNLDRQSFSAQFQVGQSQWFSLAGINTPVDSGAIVFFDRSAGGRIRLSPGIRFFRVQTDRSAWGAGDTVILVSPAPLQISDTLWNPDGNTLALGKGTDAVGISPEDTIRMVYTIGIKERVVEAVGGGGRILFDGLVAGDSINALERIAKRFRTDRHPRTFVAIDRDSSTLFLCTVDGRQAASIGMNFAEMADFLLSIGGWNAVNLDGGGSTAMVIDGVVVNRPSDKSGERAVANTLMIVESGSAP